MATKKAVVMIISAVLVVTFCNFGYAQTQGRIKIQQQKTFFTKPAGLVSATPISIPRTYDDKNPHLLKNPALDPGLGP